MSYVKIENLRFRYKKSKDLVINDFSIEMDKGEILALVGYSGSGKSTILRLLSGLETPIDGKIEVDSKILFSDKDKVNIPPEKRDIGMIFQDYALFPHLSVLGNVRFAIRDGNKKERTEKAVEYLKLVRMEEHMDKRPHQCSGGQQQRIAIARAMGTNPKLLLLDEPFSNLDAMLRADIRAEVRDILKKAQISAILVTHDHDDVKASSDRCVVLNPSLYDIS